MRVPRYIDSRTLPKGAEASGREPEEPSDIGGEGAGVRDMLLTRLDASCRADCCGLRMGAHGGGSFEFDDCVIWGLSLSLLAKIVPPERCSLR